MTILATLLYPFETDLLPLPGAGARGIVCNALPGMRPPAGFGAELQYVQGFRPEYLALQRERRSVSAEPTGEQYDLAMVVAGRHRRQNDLWIAEALARTKPGGTILVAGTKNDGIVSLRKRVAGLIPLDGSASKHHGIVFWIRKPADANAAVAALTPAPTQAQARFYTVPGSFSADDVDRGSKLLADSLPGDLKGRVADFCAGWGYIAWRLGDHEKIDAVDLYEADYAALEAARRNLDGLPRRLEFYWHDLVSEPVTTRYDAIVMNPPFHRGRAAEPGIGLAMIRASHAALKPGGRLFLVANSGLPYEAALASLFKDGGQIVREAGFKVLWAKR